MSRLFNAAEQKDLLSAHFNAFNVSISNIWTDLVEMIGRF